MFSNTEPVKVTESDSSHPLSETQFCLASGGGALAPSLGIYYTFRQPTGFPTQPPSSPSVPPTIIAQSPTQLPSIEEARDLNWTSLAVLRAKSVSLIMSLWNRFSEAETDKLLPLSFLKRFLSKGTLITFLTHLHLSQSLLLFGSANIGTCLSPPLSKGSNGESPSNSSPHILKKRKSRKKK